MPLSIMSSQSCTEATYRSSKEKKYYSFEDNRITKERWSGGRRKRGEKDLIIVSGESLPERKRKEVGFNCNILKRWGATIFGKKVYNPRLGGKMTFKTWKI